MAPRWLNKFRSLYANAAAYHALPESDRFPLWSAGTRDIDREFSARTKGKVLLDLGCGPPEARRAVREIECSQYVGVDFLLDTRPDVVTIINCLCLRDSSIDSISCVMLLEHVYRPHEVIAEMFRVLRPGGCVRVVVPFVWQYHGYPDDYFRYTHTALRRMFEEAGFRVAILETEWTKGAYLNAAKLLEDAGLHFVRPWCRFLTRALAFMLFRLSPALDKYHAPGQVGMYYAVAMLAERAADTLKWNGSSL